VGFSYPVSLCAPASSLGEAAKLRLMKAFSLALAQRYEPDAAVAITITVDPSGQPGARLDGRPGDEQARRTLVVHLTPAWLEHNDRTLEHLRAAVLALVGGALEAAGPAPVAARVEASASAAAPQLQAEVLLFSNPFELDVDARGESTHVNPGIHYLISALHARGVTTLLVEAKHPLQNVCEEPPDVRRRLEPEQVLSHPAALEQLLAEHPDLNLVCLTLLERTFAQVRDLCRFIRERSNAFIAVGGVCPTLLPEHCLVHLPDANFVVRGDGEQVLCDIVAAVAGRTLANGFDADTRRALGALEGVVARAGDWTVSARLDRINRVQDVDQSTLDFSFFQQHNVRAGVSLSTSRGCIYGCRFCSVMDRQLWRAKSSDAVARMLDDYGNRLAEIYGSTTAVPADARRVQIWDDDFFLDRPRALAILRHLADRGYTTSFLQGTVSSFFVREGRKVTEQLDEELVEGIPQALFTDYGGLKLGTENFCDAELVRLGKPYRYTHIRQLTLALARRGLPQDHYLILCNRQTSLNDLLDNFEKIAELRWRAGKQFNVLSPSWLMNLFATVLYQSCMVQGTDLTQPNIGVLRVDGYPEFDYPHVVPERPARREVFDIVRRFPTGMHFGIVGEVDWCFDGIYEPEDEDYLRVFEHTRRALSERAALLCQADDLASRAELYRVEDALARRLGPPRAVTTGLLGRLAPQLDLLPPAGGPERLAAYLEAVLERAPAGKRSRLRFQITTSQDGAWLVASDSSAQVELLVQRYAKGAACAFHTPNLAFIVQSPVETEEQRRRLGPLIDAVRQLVTDRDEHPLG
jgi:hypothetical protein